MRSRGTPRLANNRLRWVCDYVTSKADGRVTLGLTHAALDMQGIDSVGSTARIASTWRPSSASFTAGRWGSKPSLTR